MTTTDLLPGVFAAASSNTASPAVSSRYAHVRTLDVLQPLLDEGWTVRRQAVALSTVVLPEHRAHEIRLAPAGLRQVGDSIPEVIVRNGADGATALSVSAGLFRLVCANGLTVGSASFEARVRHVGVDLQTRVITAARDIAAKTEQLPEIVARWSERTLSWAERVEFNRRAAALRWSEANLTVDMGPAGFGTVLRHEDAGPDLWRTFNRAQESVIRGGVMVSRHLPQIDREIVTRRARAVSSIDAAARLNTSLWNLAAEFAN
jgi:hypothetical protein